MVSLEGIREVLTKQLRLFDEEGLPNLESDLLADVEAAYQEWVGACAYFENVTEPDLIDHAIYTMEAAEKKYMYVLKKARSQGVQGSKPTFLRS
ncbi:MAG: DUF2508 family protein [Limnochordia bacterium]